MLSLTVDYQTVFVKNVVEQGLFLAYIPSLELDAFSSKNLKNIFLAMRLLYTNGFPISYKSLRQILMTKFSREDYINAYAHLLNIKQMPRPTRGDGEVVESVIVEYIKLESLKFAIAESALLVENGDVDKVSQVLMTGLSQVVKETNGYFYFSGAKARYERLMQTVTLGQDLIRPMIPAVEAKLNHGGFLKTQLVLFAGRLGTGKSYTLTAMAKNFIQQKKKGIYCNLEMSLDEQSERLDSAVLKIPPEDLFLDTKKTVRNLKTLMKVWGDNLYLIEFPPMATTMLNIKQLIQTLRMRSFDPDFVVVDGADYLAPIKRTGDSYWDTGTPYVELKQLAVEEHVLILADCQIHRKDAESDAFIEGTLGTEHTAHSYLRAMAASTFITINQTKDEYQKGLVRWSLAKQRGHGKKYDTIKLAMETEKISIHEPFNTPTGKQQAPAQKKKPIKKKP